ncbi:MAG: DUF72 domain-containing protein, partial [Hyphomicrobiaceae bacterium]|nr:DUF72 domain-containing protein [Hyphomicrobiaceae bacterium]
MPYETAVGSPRHFVRSCDIICSSGGCSLRTPIYIGPAGWSYPDWAGSVYPPKKQRDFDPLEFISSYFNLIEINSTFYRLPARET